MRKIVLLQPDTKAAEPIWLNLTTTGGFNVTLLKSLDEIELVLARNTVCLIAYNQISKVDLKQIAQLSHIFYRELSYNLQPRISNALSNQDIKVIEFGQNGGLALPQWLQEHWEKIT